MLSYFNYIYENMCIYVHIFKYYSGAGAAITGPFIIQTPAFLGGFFSLQIFTPFFRQSDPIPYDASMPQVFIRNFKYEYVHLYMYMYLYIYVYILYTYMYAYMYVYIYVYFLYMHFFIYVYMYIYVHTNICIYICIYIYMYIYINICPYVF
jgi:hypothetical protein